MSDKTRTALAILGISLILGILGDLLFRALPLGLNVPIWITALISSAILLLYHREKVLDTTQRWLVVPIAFFALTFIWRDSLVLNLLNFMALVTTILLICFASRPGWLRIASSIEYLVALLLSATLASVGSVLLLFDIEWRSLPQGQWSKTAVALLRGLALAIPILVIFGALLMSADANFEKLLVGLVDFNLNNLFLHGFLIALFGASSCGLLRNLLLGTEIDLKNNSFPKPTLGIIEVSTILGLINLLFLSFVIIQIRYFFGGRALINSSTWTFAEYARRGFFELVTVAALVLPMLLLIHWLLNKEHPQATKVFNILALGQIMLLFIMMSSALHRMWIYQQEYGLTELRLYTTIFMLWLGALFIWFSLTVLRKQRQHFAFGVLVSGLLTIGFLNLFNPDGYIVRTNIERALAGQSFDAYYNSSLSNDATPLLLQQLTRLKIADQQEIASHLKYQWSADKSQDWRSFNISRTQAQRAIQASQPILNSIAPTTTTTPAVPVVPNLP